MEFGERPFRGDRPDAKRVAAAHTALARALVGLLDLVPELDSDAAWLRNSATDMVSWLTFDLGVAPRTARAWTRVGRSLADLTVIREAFAAGAVSFDEVVVLCRFATSENESELLELTRHVPQAELAAAIKELLDSAPSEPEPADGVLVEHCSDSPPP